MAPHYQSSRITLVTTKIHCTYQQHYQPQAATVLRNSPSINYYLTPLVRRSLSRSVACFLYVLLWPRFLFLSALPLPLSLAPYPYANTQRLMQQHAYSRPAYSHSRKKKFRLKPQSASQTKLTACPKPPATPHYIDTTSPPMVEPLLPPSGCLQKNSSPIPQRNIG